MLEKRGGTLRGVCRAACGLDPRAGSVRREGQTMEVAHGERALAGFFARSVFGFGVMDFSFHFNRSNDLLAKVVKEAWIGVVLIRKCALCARKKNHHVISSATTLE